MEALYPNASAGEYIVGKPTMYFILTLESNGQVLPVALAGGFMTGSSAQQVLIHWFGGPSPLGALSYQMKDWVASTSFAPAAIDVEQPPYKDKFQEAGALPSKARAVYEEYARQVHRVLTEQIEVPASSLGAAARRLDGIVGFIRGLSSWLYPDLIACDAPLRSSLYGPTPEWLRSPSSVDELKAAAKGSAMPLLTSAALRGMLGGVIGPEGVAAPSSDWSRTMTLQQLSNLAEASAMTFVENLRHSATAHPRRALPEVDDALDRLRIFTSSFSAMA